MPNRMQASLLYVEQFYYPDGWGGTEIPLDISMHLASLGWRVTVLCGTEQYVQTGTSTRNDPGRAGVSIIKIPRLFPGHVHSLKLARQLWFCLLSLPRLLARRDSMCITQTNPPLIVPVVALSSVLRRRRFIIVAQDLYPDLLCANGLLRPGSAFERALSVVFGWAFRKATRVVSLGGHMTRRLLDKGVVPERIVEIPNWATGNYELIRGDRNVLRDEWHLRGKFVVLYSGNLGVAHDVETPIRAIAMAVLRCPHLRLVFVGGGARCEQARRLACELRVEEFVQFRAWVADELLSQCMGLADIALVTLGSRFGGTVVPNKLMGYLARGIPIFYIGPSSEARDYVERAEAGMCFSNGSEESIATALCEISAQWQAAAGRNGLKFYNANFGRTGSLARYVELVHAVALEDSSKG